MNHAYRIVLLGALATYAMAAAARVHTVHPAQTITFNFDDNDFYEFNPRNVAIDGDSAIAIVEHSGGRSAILYRRNASGQWAQTRVLLDVSNPDSGPDDLKMADGVAALRLSGVLHVFERGATGDWSESPTAGTPTPAPGLATSGHRILYGRRGCNYDANVYARSSSGTWSVAGRASGSTGQCNDHGAMLDLEGDVALVANPPNEIREYRRNGTAFDWPQVGTILAPAGVNLLQGPPSLHGNVAFANSGDFFRRANGGWEHAGKVLPLDVALGTRPGASDYRDDIVLSYARQSYQHALTYPYLYHENASGEFEHVAILDTLGDTAYADVSGNTAIVSSQDDFGLANYIEFFELPAAIVSPPAIANDFEARDISGFRQISGSSFALATTGSNYVYRQSAPSAAAQAVVNGSDWRNFQSVEADVTPTAFDTTDRWVGVAVRYVDVKNYYYLALRNTNKLQLRRVVNGVFTTLAEQTVSVTTGTKYHVRLQVDGSRLSAEVVGLAFVRANDTALTHGSAALMTSGARADFDNLYVAPTAGLGLAYDQPGSFDGSGATFTEEGGHWEWVDLPDAPPTYVGNAQTSTSGNAYAYLGAPIDDQRVDVLMRLDQYNTSGGWFGVLARWVDNRNFYYLTIRSSGRIEIHKMVNGSITVLKAAPFTAIPGRYYNVRFEALGNELHAFVDGAPLVSAIDNDIPKGVYGLGSYRAAFTYQTFSATQP